MGGDNGWQLSSLPFNFSDSAVSSVVKRSYREVHKEPAERERGCVCVCTDSPEACEKRIKKEREEKKIGSFWTYKRSLETSGGGELGFCSLQV